MLKKTLLFAMIGLCVSAFAATIDINKYDFKNLTAEQVNEMKAYLSSSDKKEYIAAVCAIAVYRYNNPNEDLTLAKMEEIAKSVYGEKTDVYGSVLRYIANMQWHSKYANQLLTNSNYNKLIHFCNMVSYGAIKADNVNDFRLVIITESKDKKSVAKNVNLLINDCQKLKDEDAIAYLKAAYRSILPRLADDAEFKPVAAKLGLALRSYGVDVK